MLYLISCYIFPEFDSSKIHTFPLFPADVQDVASYRDHSASSGPDLRRKCASLPRKVVEDGQQSRCR